jgi:hypothetical protein
MGSLERDIYRQATDLLLQQLKPTQYQTLLKKAIEKAFSLPFISGNVN